MAIIAKSKNKAGEERYVRFGRKKIQVLSDKYALHYDYKLLITIMILCSIGLIMVYSSSAYTAANSADMGYNQFAFLKKEAAMMAAGFLLMLVVSKIDYHIFAKFTPLIYIMTVILMILTDFTPLGVEINGQKRWLHMIPWIKKTPTYQPSELVKISIILVFAALINRGIRHIDSGRIRFILILLLSLPTALVLKGNLSAAIIILGIGCLMYFTASRASKLYLFVLVLAITVFAVAYLKPDLFVKLGVLKAYQLKRIDIWRDPSSDPLGDGYQILQGLYAIGSGGWFGKGLGNSVQKLSFIPESYNDMIFSIICEELGIFGAICIIGLFAYMISRFLYIIQRAPDLYGAMIVTGAMIQISLQVIFNVAVVTNLIPNTGITLPFISYGGTAVAILLAEMGMVLSVSNQIIYEK